MGRDVNCGLIEMKILEIIYIYIYIINSPTSSHISAPSKDPIVTSNSESLFFIQASFSLNRSDFLECSIIWCLFKIKFQQAIYIYIYILQTVLFRPFGSR